MTLTQNHMHLALTKSATGEKAPIYKWKSVDEQIEPTHIASIDQSLDGTVRVHRVRRVGVPVRLVNYNYKLKVSDYGDGMTMEERVDLLLAMQGEKVWLVNHNHVADGADHTAYVKQMICAQVGKLEPLRINFLDIYYVGVELIDGRFAI